MRITNNLKQDSKGILAITESSEKILNEEVLKNSKILKDKIGHNLVFLLCHNTAGSLLTYLSCLEAGVVPLLLESTITIPLLKRLIDLYEPMCIISSETEKREISTLSQEWGERWTSIISIRDYSAWRTHFTKPVLHPDLCLLLSTSGSTGSPKLVRLTAENLDANAISIVEYLSIDQNERPITMLPMSYSYGMSIINSHVLCGAPIILSEKTIMEEDFWKRVRSENVTSLVGVPATYQIFDKLMIWDMNLPSVETLTQAGGKLSVELQKKFGEWCQSTGRKFFVMYGQTEAAPRMGYLPAEQILKKSGSMGIPIPGGRMELIDVEGKKINIPHVTGELVYHGRNVGMGYAQNKEDLALGDIWKGTLITGDMAEQDEDGYFYIVGRKKRFVKILGKRVNLDELERDIASKFQKNVAVVGTDERIDAFIEDEKADLIIISDYIVLNFAIPNNFIQIHKINELPRNQSGKIQYGDLLKMR